MEGSIRFIFELKWNGCVQRCKKGKACDLRQGDKWPVASYERKRESSCGSERTPRNGETRSTVEQTWVELDQLGTGRCCHVSLYDPRLTAVSGSWINITEIWQPRRYPTLYLYVSVRRRRLASKLPLVASVLRCLPSLGLYQSTAILIFLKGELFIWLQVYA